MTQKERGRWARWKRGGGGKTVPDKDTIFRRKGGSHRKTIIKTKNHKKTSKNWPNVN
jgi:hypothetical protein